jgi:uncharacterized membrane protein YkoI
MELKNRVCLLVMIIMMVMVGPSWGSEPIDRIQAQKIALEKTDVSLTQIINSIESDPGVRVVKVETEPFSLAQGPMCYDLLTAKGTSSWVASIFKCTKATEYYVDVTSGKVLLKKKPFWGYFYFSADNKATALSQVKLPMTQAIGLAEKAVGGKTVLVRVHRDSGIVFYQITMIVNDALKRVLVDSYNGKVTEVPMDKHGHFKD